MVKDNEQKAAHSKMAGPADVSSPHLSPIKGLSFLLRREAKEELQGEGPLPW
jgi:hypothetical protein